MSTVENIDEVEILRNENKFLKITLVREYEAHPGTIQTQVETPSIIENRFCDRLTTYNKQGSERKRLTVFDRIGRPVHFKQVHTMPGEEIDNAWYQLESYLTKNNISLSVCWPDISNRELYRFTTEELFDFEINNAGLPGSTCYFTYEDFHPNHKQDNISHAVNDCIRMILKKQHFTWMPMMKSENLRINNLCPLSEQEYLLAIDHFKQSYHDISLQKMNDPLCTFHGNSCYVKGDYDVILSFGAEQFFISGKWMVEYEFEKDNGIWLLGNVQLEGINFM